MHEQNQMLSTHNNVHMEILVKLHKQSQMISIHKDLLLKLSCLDNTCIWF